ncbi:hypothetical protein L6472_11210 [Prevotella sp. E13-17]|uniref:hypothetical protein n=1 Tax=Prevotella sp. E13-17 TaxID=2913616 RepID=UPI001EDAE8A4|nr:hypothetical protein [Prevotella sp. E13-17]UKK50578.1 hypothetical protein L6472_11210 [Prevotella sp. E13-17]
MGGNGAYDKYRSYSLDIYQKDRFKEVAMIGSNKVITTSVYNNTSIPMNSFNSKMYYVTSPKDLTKIVAIAFYSGRTHKIVKSIDLVYDKSDNLVPFKVVKRKGKIHKVGTHTHNWNGNKEKGEAKRKAHDKNNFFEPSKTDMKFIKKALKYNQEHKKNKL